LLTWRSDTFAYAESYDDQVNRYRGLHVGQMVNVSADSAALIVKPSVAQQQMEAEVPTKAPPGEQGTGSSDADGTTRSLGVTGTTATTPRPATLPRRFHGSVTLDAARVGRDASRIADEVIVHLVGLMGSNVTVTLEIEAEMPNGAPDNVVRTVTENSRTLKFTAQGFETE
jgi:hypothetical protein